MLTSNRRSTLHAHDRLFIWCACCCSTKAVLLHHARQGLAAEFDLMRYKAKLEEFQDCKGADSQTKMSAIERVWYAMSPSPFFQFRLTLVWHAWAPP